MWLTSARTTPANDGVNIGGALRHVRFSTTRKQRNAALAARTEMQRRSICPMEIANAHIHVLPKLD